MNCLCSIYKEISSECFDLNNRTDENAEEFIKKFFRDYEKCECFDSQNAEGLKKTFHSVSVFLLGLHILEKASVLSYSFLGMKDYCDDIENYNFKPRCLKTFCKKDGNIYIWTWTSLYHDIMTKYEQTFKPFCFCNCPSQISPKDFIYAAGLHQCPVTRTIFDYDCDILREVWSKEKFNPTYNVDEVERYFTMRLHNGCLDHGIMSGYVFYDRLVSSFIREMEKAGNQNGEFTSDKGLTYRKSHLRLFRYIADAIIAHNIWRYDRESALEYSHYGIETEKFAENKNLLNVKNNALVFLLCLADTMEPTKFFCQFNPNYVLEHIIIDIKDKQNGEITIKVKNNMEMLNIEEKNKWFNQKIKSMEKWLDLSVEVHDDNSSCTIRIGKGAKKGSQVMEVE